MDEQAGEGQAGKAAEGWDSKRQGVGLVDRTQIAPHSQICALNEPENPPGGCKAPPDMAVLPTWPSSPPSPVSSQTTLPPLPSTQLHPQNGKGAQAGCRAQSREHIGLGLRAGVATCQGQVHYSARRAT